MSSAQPTYPYQPKNVKPFQPISAGELCYVLPIVLRESKSFVEGLHLIYGEIRRLKRLMRSFRAYASLSIEHSAKQKLLYFSQYVRPLTTGIGGGYEDIDKMYCMLKVLCKNIDSIVSHFEARLLGVKDSAQRGKKRVRKALDTTKKAISSSTENTQVKEAGEILRVEYCTYEASVLTQLNSLLAAASKTEFYIRTSLLEISGQREAVLNHISKISSLIDAAILADTKAKMGTDLEGIVGAAVGLIRESERSGSYELKKEAAQGMKGIGIKTSGNASELLMKLGLLTKFSDITLIDKTDSTIKPKNNSSTDNTGKLINIPNKKTSFDDCGNSRSKSLYNDNVVLSNISMTLPPSHKYEEKTINPLAALVSQWSDIGDIAPFTNTAPTEDEMEKMFATLNVSPEIGVGVPASFVNNTENNTKNIPTTWNTSDSINLDEIWGSDPDVDEEKHPMSIANDCNNGNNNQYNKSENIFDDDFDYMGGEGDEAWDCPQPKNTAGAGNTNGGCGGEPPITMRDILRKYGEDNDETDSSFDL